MHPLEKIDTSDKENEFFFPGDFYAIWMQNCDLLLVPVLFFSKG